MKKQIPLITYGVIAMFLITFGFYTSTIQYADAVSTVSVTFLAGTTTSDVAYIHIAVGSGTNAFATVVGANAGQAYAWTKNSNDVITANVTLTGSTSSRAVEYYPVAGQSIVATNDKYFKLSPSLAIAGQFATAQAGTTIDLIYEPTSGTMYFCFNDGYGTLNLVTLVPTVLYTDAGLNAVLGCALDVEAGAMYLTGSSVGGSFDIIRVSLATHTITNSQSIANFYYGVCVDTENNIIWALESSMARVAKYNGTLALQTTVTVGTTPRHCSISDDEGARRLYVANEGTDNVSIIDIDANTVLATPSVCDTVAARLLDTARFANTTRTFVTCNSNVNTVIVDDTVSAAPPEGEGTIGGIDCDLPENENILICRLGGDGTLGSAGAFVVGNITEGTGILGIGCSIGLVDCTEDDNPQTNGLGLLIFIASIFVIVGMFYRSLGAQATFQIPVFLWVVIIVALSAFFTITGIIDPIFLILSIVAVIALAVPKVIGVIQNRSFGGGGSTE